VGAGASERIDTDTYTGEETDRSPELETKSTNLNYTNRRSMKSALPVTDSSPA
jgi:hypothetical protein